MPTKITYYAIVDDFSSRDNPAESCGASSTTRAEYDQAVHHDLSGSTAGSLYSYERGNVDSQFYEISEDEANRIVERIRRSVTGQP